MDNDVCTGTLFRAFLSCCFISAESNKLTCEITWVFMYVIMYIMAYMNT